MKYGIPLLRDLVGHFKKLPGVGEKTARRLVFAILDMENEEVESFAQTLSQVKKRVGFCERCGNFTEERLCQICRDSSRDESIICVVERPTDIFILEESGQYKGSYHVLHGVLSPLDGVGPDDLNIDSLEERLKEGGVKEVIVATNPGVEGDTTTLYISRICSKYGIEVTVPARGIPLGSSLEYMDGGTIGQALEGRRKL
jgi:recombination protein RecR